jgi:hypothetical protein
MKIIQQRQRVQHVHYERVFFITNSRGGYAFECDPDGTVNESELSESRLASYRGCLDGTLDVEDQGIRRLESTEVLPRIGECSCGERIHLMSFTNHCEGCGTDYNTAGQRLAPRTRWGYETGEDWRDLQDL